MARNMKPASADTVRAWAMEQGWTDQYGRAPKDRGRLNSELVADFDKAHKRNFVHYVPGYRDDTTASAGQGNGGNTSGRSTSRSTEVATRPAARATAPARQTSAKTTDEKATARRSRPADDESPVRVQAERVSTDLASMPVSTINIEDAIALLSSAAAGRKKGDAPTGMLAYYVLV